MRQLLTALEIEVAVLLETFVEELPKRKRRAFVRRLKRNTRRLVRDKAKIGEGDREAAELGAARLQAHIKALRSLVG